MKVIVITIAVASLSTTALADARVAKHRTLHRQVVMGVGAGPALLNANASLNGNGSDHAMRIRNLRDSGYNPKSDVDSFGVMSVAQ